jgi:hypothetical protein
LSVAQYQGVTTSRPNPRFPGPLPVRGRTATTRGPRRDAVAARCVSGCGHHLPDRGQVASPSRRRSSSPSPRARVATPGTSATVRPRGRGCGAAPAGSRPSGYANVGGDNGGRAHVATPGRCTPGHHLPDRGQTSRAHVATPGRCPPCRHLPDRGQAANVHRRGHPLPDRGQRLNPRRPVPASRRRAASRPGRGTVGHYLPDRAQAATITTVIATSVASCPRRDVGAARCYHLTFHGDNHT